MTKAPQPKIRDSIDQDQFLTILSREEALERFGTALFPRHLPDEQCKLADALGRALAQDVTASVDAPPFDRSNVDGFAVRSADLAFATEGTPVRLMLNDEVIACGVAPTRPVLWGTATAIATGGPLPRGADSVVMIEHTQRSGVREIDVRRATSPGQFVSYAGSDIARGETLLRAGTIIGSREIGMLSACGIAEIPVVRRPRVAVISTGDELVPPGEPLRPAAIYDTNGAVVTAAIDENGGNAVFLGAVPDNEEQLEAAMRKALEETDMLVFSGGTSKGAGDVSHSIIAKLGQPGIIAHGVSLKPGKPLCLAVCDGKALVILPGFPTSAMFTFHDTVVPVLRRMAGLPPRSDAKVTAKVPVRIASELGRTEFVMRRADWGMTIAPVAYAADLGFIPFAEEHYDFTLVTTRKQRPAVQAFLDALASNEARAALRRLQASVTVLNVCCRETPSREGQIDSGNCHNYRRRHWNEEDQCAQCAQGSRGREEGRHYGSC